MSGILADPKHIFAQAAGYQYASEISWRQFSQDMANFAEGRSVQNDGPTGLLALPMLALQAFALELYFKALYVAQKNEAPPFTHDLLKLFRKLPDETRLMIEAFEEEMVRQTGEYQILRQLSKDTDSFEERLTKCRNAFEVLRYSFEPKNKGKASWNANSILRATSAVCRTLYPDWHADTLPMTPNSNDSVP